MDYSKAVKCALLSQEVYKEFSDQLRFSEFPDITPDLVEQTDTDTQCAILSDTTGANIYIVFRGTEKRLDWKTNRDLKQIVFEFQQVLEFQQQVIQKQVVQKQEPIYPYTGESRSGAQMHQGFANAYTTSVRKKIHDYLRSHTAANVTVTGHSLGGALATLCAVDIQYNFSNQVKIELYTFGAPRVGNEGFRESFNRRVPNSYRFVHGMDIVPALPRSWQGYQHVDAEHRFGPRFSLNFFSQRIKDHQIAKYIAGLQELAAKSSSG